MIDQLLVLLFGVFDVLGHGSGQAPLSPREIYMSPARLDGQSVSATGYSPNGRCLYQSKERHRQFLAAMRENAEDFDPADYDEDGITLIGPGLTHREIRLLSGRSFIVRGTLIANYQVDGLLDFQACGQAAILIDRGNMRWMLARLRRSGPRAR
jgi:hypothetical protein